MRLPTRALGRSVSPARRALGRAFLSLSLGATPALATHYVVDLNGGGDFTTIQAAIDAQSAVFRDTILVMPGDYAETIALPRAPAPLTRIIATGGASLTSTRSLTAPNDAGGGSIRSYNLDGFTFTETVALEGQYQSRARFARCVFQQGLSSNPLGAESSPIVFDCDFYGRTRLEWCYGTWQSLRFHGAPLTITHASGTGSFILRGCSFEGPADTLVHVPWSSYDHGAFDQCTFSNAQHGIVYGNNCILSNFPITSCVFRDLSGNAIATTDTLAGTSMVPRAKLSVSDSRFERCGTAVRWVHGWNNSTTGDHGALLLRDSIFASVGDAVVLGAQVGGGISDCIVDGSGGRGAVFQQSFTAWYQLSPAMTQVSNSRFTNNRFDGLSIRDSIPLESPRYPNPPAGFVGPVITGSTFAGNGGAGLRVVAARWNVRNCVAFENAGDGFDLTNTSPPYPLVTTSNTSALNGGDGFRLSVLGAPRDSAHIVRSNLAVMNAGAGLRVPPAGEASFAFNDASNNYLGQYVGVASPADSNLTVDPRFCDLGAGDLGLQQGSPCGAGGVYGLIGALPEQCPNTTAVEGAAPRLSFVVRPTVARGSVEFVPPAAGGEGRVEVFDLSGRRLWSAAFGPATGALRWRGDTATGRARAGLYWVRFTRAGESNAQRLVWLE